MPPLPPFTPFPSPFRIGTDICHIPRILKILKGRNAEKFAEKILRHEELEDDVVTGGVRRYHRARISLRFKRLALGVEGTENLAVGKREGEKKCGGGVSVDNGEGEKARETIPRLGQDVGEGKNVIKGDILSPMLRAKALWQGRLEMDALRLDVSALRKQNLVQYKDPNYGQILTADDGGKIIEWQGARARVNKEKYKENFRERYREINTEQVEERSVAHNAGKAMLNRLRGSERQQKEERIAAHETLQAAHVARKEAVYVKRRDNALRRKMGNCRREQAEEQNVTHYAKRRDIDLERGLRGMQHFNTRRVMETRTTSGEGSRSIDLGRGLSTWADTTASLFGGRKGERGVEVDGKREECVKIDEGKLQVDEAKNENETMESIADQNPVPDAPAKEKGPKDPSLKSDTEQQEDEVAGREILESSTTKSDLETLESIPDSHSVLKLPTDETSPEEQSLSSDTVPQGKELENSIDNPALEDVMTDPGILESMPNPGPVLELRAEEASLKEQPLSAETGQHESDVEHIMSDLEREEMKSRTGPAKNIVHPGPLLELDPEETSLEQSLVAESDRQDSEVDNGIEGPPSAGTKPGPKSLDTMSDSALQRKKETLREMMEEMGIELSPEEAAILASEELEASQPPPKVVWPRYRHVKLGGLGLEEGDRVHPFQRTPAPLAVHPDVKNEAKPEVLQGEIGAESEANEVPVLEKGEGVEMEGEEKSLEELEMEMESAEVALRKTARFLAGRFSAKEAIIKAHCSRRLTFHDILILRSERKEGQEGSLAPVAVVLPEGSPPLSKPGEMEGEVEGEGEVKGKGVGIAGEGEGVGESGEAKGCEKGQKGVAKEVRISISHDGEYATAVALVVDG